MTTVIGGSSPSITFSDSTTQSTAALPLTGGTLTGALTPSTTSGIVGTTLGDNANAGSVGEYVSSTVAVGSGIALTSGTVANITSISLTAGDWDISGVVAINNATGTVLFNYLNGGTSTTSASLGSLGQYWAISGASQALAYNVDFVQSIPINRISISTTTTVYLTSRAGFTGGTVIIYGVIRARRVR